MVERGVRGGDGVYGGVFEDEKVWECVFWWEIWGGGEEGGGVGVGEVWGGVECGVWGELWGVWCGEVLSGDGGVVYDELYCVGDLYDL